MIIEPPPACQVCVTPTAEVKAVVHVEFRSASRRGRQRLTSSDLHGDVGIDEVVGEDAAAGQELAVTVKIFERLIKRRTDGRNLGVSSGGRS